MTETAIAPAQPASALDLTQTQDLASYFAKPETLNDVLTRIEGEVRSYAPDTSTAKGRKAIASLAAKVAKSKTALDNAGKELNEDHRKAINAVDAERRKLRDRLDALKVEARKPLTDWEETEEARLALLKDRLAALDAGRADAHSPSEQIADVLAEIEGTEIGEDWQEYQEEARIARDAAVKTLTANLEAARTREAEAVELEKLRKEAAEREQADRQRREEEAAAEALKERADKAVAYIEDVKDGMIGGKPQPAEILLYELETKLPPLIAELGPHQDRVEVARMKALQAAKDAMAKEAEERRAAEDRKREEDQRTADAEAKAREERAAQAERDRIAAEQKAEDEARAKREADEAHRASIKADIVEALSAMSGKATPDAIAEALMAGNIPHTEVRI